MKSSPTVVTLAALAAFLASGAAEASTADSAKISVKDYQDKIYAFWLGQSVGNIYGLPHENIYVDEPGKPNFPYGYVETKRMRDANGAFSDDDTDIEYVYLNLMEAHGPEPTYAQIAEYWKRHVDQKVWVANRAALAAMHYGLTPPVTGQRPVNPHWFQIDPQLVNEIWVATAPGMIRYATEKSTWAARVMSDDWGSEPTIHYGAMYAAAFFEPDVNRLIDIGTQALPPGSRFAKVVEHMKRIHRQFPNDWVAGRKAMAEAYYVNEPAETKTIWNAALNGAAGILALLYGQGDFQKTLDLACAMGFDADNQAATMAGLVAMAKGSKSIPKALLYPFPDLKWTKPLNDTYRNVSRRGLPDARLTELASRTALQGEKIILQHGGKKIVEAGKEFYVINANARFTPPLELPRGPMPIIVAGDPVQQVFTVSGATPGAKWRIASGELPRGLTFANGTLSGVAATPGVHRVTLEVSSARKNARQQIDLIVRGKNLAPEASEILASVRSVDPQSRGRAYGGLDPSLLAQNVEVICDGRRDGRGSAFFSATNTTGPHEDHYGYAWRSAKRIGLISFHTGAMDWSSGWFSSLRVEYRDAAGKWQAAKGLRITPEFPTGNDAFAINRPHFVEYLLAFEPVETAAIRIIGEAGGSEAPTRTFHYTSITELAVYPPLTGASGRAAHTEVTRSLHP